MKPKFTSIHDLLSFLNYKIYADGKPKPYRVETSNLDRSALEQMLGAAKAGFITIERAQGGNRAYSINFTSSGVLEFLLIPRCDSAHRYTHDPLGGIEAQSEATGSAVAESGRYRY